MNEHALNSNSIEEIRAVFQRSFQPFYLLEHGQTQIKLCRYALEPHRIYAQSFELQRRAWCIVKNKHHLKQRRLAEITFRLKFFHQLLKWYVLMRICPQRHFPNPSKRFSKRWIAR